MKKIKGIKLSTIDEEYNSFINDDSNIRKRKQLKYQSPL